MNTLIRLLFLFFTSLMMTAPAMAQHTMHDDQPVSADDSVGEVDFRANCDESVRAEFDRALGLMHHMMYVQARAAYEDVARSAPDCAMAHWGVATTLFQPLWGTLPSSEEITRGREAIKRAEELADNEREQSLIRATAAFYGPDTDRLQPRLAGWIEGMDSAYESFPDDPDIASLYALSRLALALESDDRQALHDEAESVLRAVWDEEPRHPGAVHYSIHATDADGRADNALEIVESYGQIAPKVPHALHMPSHIYVRLGDWPSVIEWNERSAQSAIDHKSEGATSFHYIHALDYLVYGHLQRGEDTAAHEVWQSAQANGPHQANFPGAFHLASIPARLAVEARDWQAAAEIKTRVPDYIGWDAFYWPEGVSWFARGLGAVHTGDLAAAREAEQRLATLSESATSAADRRFSTYLEVDRLILSGWIAQAEDKPERALARMRAAGELEATVEKHPVTPGALLPPHEALGDLLLALDRPEEALAAYERSDQTWPKRYNTLSGAVRAAQAVGNKQSAAKWRERLRDVAPDDERHAVSDKQARSALSTGEHRL
ncbi:tetratricopeptide repeat protein [Marinimicrobium sp. C2-29]|uniref:tetratricopeptide repeat protein n=1 Tax=Marinimicrobium sp. C2-29 TaxID=3139825 RepID=UPI003138923A